MRKLLEPPPARKNRRLQDKVEHRRLEGKNDSLAYSASRSFQKLDMKLDNELSRLDLAIPNQSKVRDYLIRHQDMVPGMMNVLPAIAEKVHQKFGNSAQFSLEIVIDPEIDDEYIILYVRSETYDDSTIEQIDAIQKEFRPVLTGKSGSFLLTTDFAPPR